MSKLGRVCVQIRMRESISIWKIIGVALATLTTPATAQLPSVADVPEKVLRQYAGTYQWDRSHYLYLQLWTELSGKNQLVAFDESGEVRTLYPIDRDRFFAGPAAAKPAAVESRIDFQRDRAGRISRLTWRRDGASLRTARRADIETREDVRFSNGDIHLSGTLVSPKTRGRHPAIILVHGSGAEDREYVLPFAHFLVRHGIAVLGYDKRGVGESTGNWSTASFDDLATDVFAAFDYLKTRSDIDQREIGLLGWSQAGWIMPLAAVRASGFAFLISVSGPGVSPAETTLDETENELKASGRKPEIINLIIDTMKREYEFARSGQGWDQYATARAQLAARIGTPPASFPATPSDSFWQTIRRTYFYDPAPTLKRLRVPTLALFGGLDDNIVAVKNKNAWEAALKAGGNPDYTLHILLNADHLMLEAKVGNNAEIPSLQRFVPLYFTTIEDWLSTRIRGFR